MEELFWWMEDTEYLAWRIPNAGFPVIRVDDAVVTHHRERSGSKPPWKFYYETRNTVFLRLYRQRGGRRFTKLILRLPRRLARILFREDMKVAKLWMFVRGLFDGVRAEWALRFQSSNPCADIE